MIGLRHECLVVIGSVLKPRIYCLLTKAISVIFYRQVLISPWKVNGDILVRRQKPGEMLHNVLVLRPKTWRLVSWRHGDWCDEDMETVGMGVRCLLTPGTGGLCSYPGGGTPGGRHGVSRHLMSSPGSSTRPTLKVPTSRSQDVLFINSLQLF